jgi:hypothetical protein
MTAVRFPLDKLLTVYAAISEAQKRIDSTDPLWWDLINAKSALRVYFALPLDVDVQPAPAETFRNYLTKDAA